MTVDDFLKISQRRINPYRGMIIDVPIWAGAHDYHRVQQRLHGVLAHSAGVISGLDVTAADPPGSSVLIHPGVAMDDAGHMIIVDEPQHFNLQIQEEGTIYLMVQYREVPDEMVRPPGEDVPQPLYILEAYRLEERRQVPEEPYVELARIQVSGTGAPLVNPGNPQMPQPNEIDLRHRILSVPRPLGEVSFGIVHLEAGADGMTPHLPGMMNLVQAVNATTRYRADFEGTFDLNQDITGCNFLLMAGQGQFNLSGEQERVLKNYLDRGGLLVGEACGARTSSNEGPVAFRQSFGDLSRNLERNLAPVERGHSLLTSLHIFSGAPEGIDGPGLILADGGMVYSDGDYGCLWAGGWPDSAAPRDGIRSAIELGINIAVYSANSRNFQSLRTDSH